MSTRLMIDYPGVSVPNAGVAVRIGVSTGALVANTLKTVTHGLNCDDCSFLVADSNNNADVDIIKKNALDPRNKFDIQVGVNLPSGLTVTVIANNT